MAATSGLGYACPHQGSPDGILMGLEVTLTLVLAHEGPSMSGK